MKIFDTLPLRILKGAYQGLEDGIRGGIDTNEKFSDGYRENDPSKKSAAGWFLSDYAGIRGGGKIGAFIGKWGGGLAAGVFAAKFLAGAFLVGGIALSWPLIAIPLLSVGAAVVGSMALGFVGRIVGATAGAIVGGVGGALVGTYSAAFRRGKYTAPEPTPEPKSPTPAAQPKPERAAAPTTPHQGHQVNGLQAQPSQPQDFTVIPPNDPRLQKVIDQSKPEPGVDPKIASNAHVQKAGVLSRIRNTLANMSSSFMGALGFRSSKEAVPDMQAAPVMAAPAASAPMPSYMNTARTQDLRAVPPQGGFTDRHMAARQQAASAGMAGRNGA